MKQLIEGAKQAKQTTPRRVTMATKNVSQQDAQIKTQSSCI